MATVLIAAGGTGGHIVPALAVARLMLKRGLTVHWVGSGVPIERALIDPTGIPMDTIEVSGLRNRSLLTWLGVPLMLLRACWQAWRVVARVKPAGVLGMGGYVSGPVGLVAWLMRVPLLIHEQNMCMGWSNRLLTPFATRLLTAFADTRAPSKSVVVGNPIADELLCLPPPGERLVGRTGPLRVLVLGGSQGAHELNESVPAALAELPGLDIWHQGGAANVSRLEERYRALELKARVSGLIRDMARAYTWADLVVCRAGALTVSELAAVGVAAVLVPLRGLAGDHQAYNAALMETHKAAYVLSVQEIRDGALSQLLGDERARDHFLRAARAAHGLRVDGAAARVAAECRDVFCV